MAEVAVFGIVSLVTSVITSIICAVVLLLPGASGSSLLDRMISNAKSDGYSGGKTRGPSASGDTNSPVKAMTSLKEGEKLLPGEFIVSSDRKSKFLFQTDGNAVVYTNEKAGWNTGKKEANPKHLIMQSDGNLVAYDSADTAYWSTNTSGQGTKPYELILEDNGEPVLRGNSLKIVSSAWVK